MTEKKKRINWKEEAQRAILDGKVPVWKLREIVEGDIEPVDIETTPTIEQMKYDALKEIIVNLLYKMEENEINDIFNATLKKHGSMKKRSENIKAARKK